MVLIPAGKFFMGSEGWGESESPIHVVYLDDFWIDETPVTNRQFELFADEAGYQTDVERAGVGWGFHSGKYDSIAGLSWRSYVTPGREEHPVVLVTWNDAVSYCEWAGKRLPSEAEWEKVARGLLAEKLYPWGDKSPDGSQSNFARHPSEIPPTTLVRQFGPNEYGVYDCVGNVWQWCSDWYGDKYYSEGQRSNPSGPANGAVRVRRGGSWNVIQSFRLRCANRGAMDPVRAAPNVGFRCAA